VAPGKRTADDRVGEHIRENVTIHRALVPGETTLIGNENLIMVNAHVAHDCRIGDHTIITNNVMLAGHVTVGDYAYLSGGVGVHQFCRIGAHCMVGGQAHVKKDVPPYVTVDGQTTRVVGLNLIGLKRRGFSADDLAQLKAAYRIIYRQGWTWSEVLERLRVTFEAGPAMEFLTFLSDSRRGFLLERRTPHGATLPLPLPDPSAELKSAPTLKVG
jgi:UDP-N-acetylglucosamine acyltransferase